LIVVKENVIGDRTCVVSDRECFIRCKKHFQILFQIAGLKALENDNKLMYGDSIMKD